VFNFDSLSVFILPIYLFLETGVVIPTDVTTAREAAREAIV
jgi:hypothetical protein